MGAGHRLRANIPTQPHYYESYKIPDVVSRDSEL